MVVVVVDKAGVFGPFETEQAARDFGRQFYPTSKVKVTTVTPPEKVVEAYRKAYGPK